jgi:DNA-binding transcriptional regulator YhcF (GntR family)
VVGQPDLASAGGLFELEPLPGTPLGRGLRTLVGDGQRAILSGGAVVAQYELEDRGAEAATIALLSGARLASDTDLASAFGCHRNTVGRIRQRLAEGAMVGVVKATRPGPKRRHKVTPAAAAVVAENSELSLSELQALVEKRAGVRISRSHLHRLVQVARTGRPVQVELELETEAAESDEPPAVVAEPVEVERTDPAAIPTEEGAGPAAAAAHEPPAVVPEVARGRYLGAALYYPALRALGLVEAALANFRLPNSDLFGVRAVTLTLFFLTLLSKTTVEAAKHLRRWEFGPLVGSGRAPAVKTLRRKLAELVEQGRALEFGIELARRWVEQGVIATAYLCVDGHVHTYAGKRKVSEVWSSQRRMPLPGLLTYFVNDLKGRPLLFLTEEVNAAMAEAMPKLVAEIRKVLGDRRFTLIFDRGGYDGKLFRWLAQEGISFITYQRGSPHLPSGSFRRRHCRFEGRRVWMAIAEDKVKVGGSGPWRRIVVRTKDGHQTPILTSLADQVAAVRIACLMFARWRQENFFKYAKEHQGLDQLLGNGWAEADGERLVPNPERKQLDKEIKALRRELAELRSELGQALLDEPRDSARNAHGLKTAQGGKVGRLRDLEAELEAAVELRPLLPQRIPLRDAGRREVLRVEQKQIIDRVKISAYNAEEWLLERLLPHYPHPDDVRDLLRAFAELSGELQATTDSVTITLDPPDTPLHRRALRGLCAELTDLAAPYPGTDLPVTYRVGMHHSEAAA